MSRLRQALGPQVKLFGGSDRWSGEPIRTSAACGESSPRGVGPPTHPFPWVDNDSTPLLWRWLCPGAPYCRTSGRSRFGPTLGRVIDTSGGRLSTESRSRLTSIALTNSRRPGHVPLRALKAKNWLDSYVGSGFGADSARRKQRGRRGCRGRICARSSEGEKRHRNG
jgi:hypothetical protein